MRLLRAVVRLLIVTAITLFLTAAWTLGRLVYAPFPDRRARLRRRVVKVWATLLCRVMGIRVHVKGRPPDPPFILVANHLSYIDVLVFHSQTECVQIARADIRSWPAIGFLARYFGTLFIDRSLARDVVRVSDLIRAEIRAGNGVTFFPEGTSTRGAQVNRFKSSLLEFPAAESFPVHTASLRYETGPGEAPASETVGGSCAPMPGHAIWR